MPEKVSIPRETVPSILDQAAALNWRAGLYDFGKAEQPGFDYFNPGLVERPDGLWLMVRRGDMTVNNGFGLNGVLAIKLDESGTVPLQGTVLNWPSAAPGQQFEDARAIYIPHMKQVAVSACTFQWFGYGADPAWSGAIQVLGFFDENWQCKVLHYPPFDNNGTELKTVPREAYQKNWLWWHRHGKLHLLYKSEPWIVATFENHWIDSRMVYTGKSVRWDYGPIRGGTPPVEIGGNLVTFFHSSTPWYDRWRRYHLGVLEFSAEPPFVPLRITPAPLISGSTRDPWAFGKPPCIFPCGAVLRGDRALVTAGVNDMKSCYFDAAVEDVLRHLVPIDPHDPLKAFPQESTQKSGEAPKRRRKPKQKPRRHKQLARAVIG